MSVAHAALPTTPYLMMPTALMMAHDVHLNACALMMTGTETIVDLLERAAAVDAIKFEGRLQMPDTPSCRAEVPGLIIDAVRATHQPAKTVAASEPERAEYREWVKSTLVEREAHLGGAGGEFARAMADDGAARAAS